MGLHCEGRERCGVRDPRSCRHGGGGPVGEGKEEEEEEEVDEKRESGVEREEK